MDSVIESLQHLRLARIDAPVVYCPHRRGLVAVANLPANMYLGDIQGERLYVDDLACDLYTPGLIFLDSDRVIDARNTLWGAMRMGTYEDPCVNCLLLIDEQSGEVGFYTIRPLLVGEELVYWHEA